MVLIPASLFQFETPRRRRDASMASARRHPTATPSTRLPLRREDDEGEESDDDSLAGQAVVTVRTAMMNVKRASIVALGNLAEYTEGLFAPHLDAALECLKVLVDYFHHEIRERAAIALQQLVHGACLAHGGPARDPSYSAPPNDEKEPKANNGVESKFNSCFNFGCVGVWVRCCSLYDEECISRRSCLSLSLSEDRGAEIT